MTNITPVSVIGSCISNDILEQMPGYRTDFMIPKFVHYTSDGHTRFRQKISADATPAGNIADRLYDEMAATVYKNKTLPSSRVYDLKLQLEYVTKPRSIQSTINNAKLNPDGVIYVDLTNELLPSVITQDEEFLIKNNWKQLAPYFPVWFQEIVRKNTFQYDMYDKTMTLKRHHALRQAVKIINSANQPVVALGNVYTNKVFDHESGLVVENLSFYNDKIPFLKVNAQGQLDETINYNYNKHQIDRFYKICQSSKMSPGWEWVNVEEFCYADPKHRWGEHPIHLHINSRKIIAAKLEDAFTVGAPAR